MPKFDVDGTIKWFRSYRKGALARRDDGDLPFIEAETRKGLGLIIDTCVYIDQLQAKAPDQIEHLIDTSHVHHSAIAIQELMHLIAALDPDHEGTGKVIEPIINQLKGIPEHRIIVPDADTLSRSALLAGHLCRTQGYGKDHKLKALHDCILFMQARKMGHSVLTRNIKDFDYLLQIIPDGRVIFYRQIVKTSPP